MSFYAQSQLNSMNRPLRYVACFSEYPHVRYLLSQIRLCQVRAEESMHDDHSLRSFQVRSKTLMDR